MKLYRNKKLVKGGDAPSLLRSIQGFTLIELMIVVAIIGILSSLAISAYDIYTKKAKVSEISNALGTSLSAAQLYHSQEGKWPEIASPNGFLVVSRNTFGVELPTTYVSETGGYTLTADDTTVTVTATFRTVAGSGRIIGAGINGKTLSLSSNADGGRRNWSGTIGSRYLPRN